MGKLPVVAIEITSESTRNEDVERKFDLYQDVLGIPEYILFDPTGDYIDVRLTGYRLTPQGYILMSETATNASTVSNWDFICSRKATDCASSILRVAKSCRHTKKYAHSPHKKHNAPKWNSDAHKKRWFAPSSKHNVPSSKPSADAEAQRANAIAAELAQTRTQLEESTEATTGSDIITAQHVDARKDT